MSFGSAIAGNLYEKNTMKASLSRDGGVAQHNFIRIDSFTLKVAQVVITQRWINDSFIIGHRINGVLHDSTTASVIDEFETNNWTTVNASATTATTSIVGTYSLQCTPIDTSSVMVVSRTF